MSKELSELMKEFSKRRWVAVYYPRRKLVAMSGMSPVSEAEAIRRMKEALR